MRLIFVCATAVTFPIPIERTAIISIICFQSTIMDCRPSPRIRTVMAKAANFGTELMSIAIDEGEPS